MRAIRCVTKEIGSHEQLSELLGECLMMTYNAIHYGNENAIYDRRE